MNPVTALRSRLAQKAFTNPFQNLGKQDPGTRALQEELPYLYCGDIGGFGPLHLLSDDTLGFAFATELPVTDTVPDAEATASEAIRAMLESLAPDVQWQWFVRSSSVIVAQLERYLSQPGEDSVGRQFAQAFVERWRAAQEIGFFPEEPSVNFPPRQLCVLVALKSRALGLVPSGMGQGLEQLLFKAGSQRAIARRAADFIETIRGVLAVAHTHGLKVEPVNGDGLENWVATSLFPQRDIARRQRARREAVWGAGDELRVGLAAMGHIHHLAPRGFASSSQGEERHHRLVSLLRLPQALEPGLLNGLATLRPNLTVCLSASGLPPNLALAQIKARALLNAKSTHRFNETEMQARSEALQEVEYRVFSDGERILEMRLQIHLVEETQVEADEAAAIVSKYLQSLGIEACAEDDIGASLLLRGCLPFAVYPETERKAQRRRRALSQDCADLHCAGACWTGVKPPHIPAAGRPRPVILYGNPLGEALFIDPTKAEKNPHALVVGQSGSGKSFFVHDYLLHLWRLPDVRLFLISIKADYRKLALVLGQYLEIDLDCGISLNPFGGPPTLENQARWFAALSLMLSEGAGSPALSRDSEVVLQAAVLAAAQRNWDPGSNVALRETLLEHICLELEKTPGLLGRQLSTQLYPYRRGPYRKLFNTPRDSRFESRFIFFNLGGILRQPCAALASFCVFGIVDEVMTDARLRGVPKGLVADEVWALVRNPYAAAILERSLKAYRSLGGFAIPVVQDPQDLDTASGRVMLVNTATKIVLPMDRAGLTDLQRYVRLNEREMHIVSNLRLVKGKFSEFFVSIDGMKSAKGLLIPDPLRYAVSTTDPGDEECIEHYFHDCGNMMEALQKFANNFPHGIAQSHSQR